MAKTLIGIDIGSSTVKLLLCGGGEIRGALHMPTPDNLIEDGVIRSAASLADFLKNSVRAARFKRGKCGVVLPATAAFFRRTTMPAMKEDTLKINLPYEFRDFITEDREKYVFDYALIDMAEREDGEPISMDIMAAAALKDTIATYRDILRIAGYNLQRAIPEEIAYSDLIRRYEEGMEPEEKREYCIFDLGHTASRLYFYTGTAHEATRVIDYGGHMLDAAIAEARNVDVHTAATYKLANYEDVLTLEPCMHLYDAVGLELMQALNFYNYNNPDNALHDIYLCGGGANVAPLVESLRDKVQLTVHSIAELMPSTPEDVDAALYPLCYAATL